MSPTVSTQNVEFVLASYRAQGLSQSAAIRKLAKECPALHVAWLREVNHDRPAASIHRQ